MGDGPNRKNARESGGFVDRHLAKIVVGALALCLLLLVVRAIAG